MHKRGSLFLLVCIIAIISLRSSLLFAEPSCPPIAIIEAPPDILLIITSLLHEQGINTEEQSNCPFTKANIEPVKNGFRIDLQDSFGRKPEKTVSTLQSVAVVIESWTREEFSAPLLLKVFPEKTIITFRLQNELLPAPLLLEEPSINFESYLIPEPRVPKNLSIALQGGVKITNEQSVHSSSRFVFGIRYRAFRLGVFSQISKSSSTIQQTQFFLQHTKQALCNTDANGDGVINEFDCNGQNVPKCDTDTNGDGTIDKNDCQDSNVPDCNPIDGSNCNDPNVSECSVDTNGDGVIDNSDCKNPAPEQSDCTVDTNGDGVIEDSDCETTDPNEGCQAEINDREATPCSTRRTFYGFEAGIEASFRLKKGPIAVEPAIFLAIGKEAQNSLSPTMGVALSAVAKIRRQLFLEFRMAVEGYPTKARPLFPNSLWGGFGIRWELEN